jgi:hypothetical protein
MNLALGTPPFEIGEDVAMTTTTPIVQAVELVLVLGFCACLALGCYVALRIAGRAGR